MQGPVSVMNSLTEHIGKRVRITLTTTGAHRIHGRLRGTYQDGVLVDVASPGSGETTRTIVLASNIATIEVMG